MSENDITVRRQIDRARKNNTDKMNMWRKRRIDVCSLCSSQNAFAEISERMCCDKDGDGDDYDENNNNNHNGSSNNDNAVENKSDCMCILECFLHKNVIRLSSCHSHNSIFQEWVKMTYASEKERVRKPHERSQFGTRVKANGMKQEV